MTDPYRIMVIDDSFVVRALLVHLCDNQDDLRIVASASQGASALAEMLVCKPDVITLDIDMPGMNGLELIPQILQRDADVAILMISALTHKNAEVSLKALRAGALDYLPKPAVDATLNLSDGFRRDLLIKLRELGALTRRRRVQHARKNVPDTDLVLNPSLNFTRPNVIAIGASTGGPAALFDLLKKLHGRVTQPIVITQHMPAHFTTVLAQHITTQTGFSAHEVTSTMTMLPGHVYVAHGERHLIFSSDGYEVMPDAGPARHYCRPSVDVMIESALSVFDHRVLAVMLTGMGQDGAASCAELCRRGGAVLAQNEASSVVWGMPGAVAKMGICAAIADLNGLALSIVTLANKSEKLADTHHDAA